MDALADVLSRRFGFSTEATLPDGVHIGVIAYQPEEVAKAIYFLCTDQSSYVTGAELHINGGQHV